MATPPYAATKARLRADDAGVPRTSIVETKPGTPLPDLGEDALLKMTDWRLIQARNPGLSHKAAEELNVTLDGFYRAINAEKMLARYEGGKLVLELHR